MSTVQPQASRIIKRDLLKIHDNAVPLASTTGSCAAPVVRLVRTGDVVRAIRVDCLCGRSLEIECVFDTNDGVNTPGEAK